MGGKNFFATRWGVIAVGALIGLIASILQKFGNPGNMGICVACFERDIAGAVGMHRAPVVQYLRPEIIGFVLGSLSAATASREFRARGGSSPIVRFFLGVFAMIGALVFLGCPWRAMLRLAGGDLNAITGIAGLSAGIWIGTLFLKKGYSLGRAESAPKASGLVFPLMMVALLLIMLLDGESGVLHYSTKGPGAMHAPLVLSLTAGLMIGFIAQRSRFCTMGAIRDLILFRQTHLLTGMISLVCAAFLANLAFGQVHPGFIGQPVAHTIHVFNFTGMVLAGLAFTLAGGCPGRQLFLSGEGDGDAAVFVMGMFTGGALAHNFALASSPAGPGAHGAAAVITGIAFCLFVGTGMARKKE